MVTKIRKDILLPLELLNRINEYQKKVGLNFTSTLIVLLNDGLELKESINFKFNSK